MTWRLWPRRIADFGDACMAALGSSGVFDELATFDIKFAKRARRLGVPSHW